MVVSSVYAQQFNEKQVQLIEGKTYYLHKVEKGNTLYSLSKMYSIKVKDLISENPQLEEGLKIGQVIRIPIKKVDTKLSGGNTPDIEGEYLIHTVVAKETMYGLTKRYSVTAEDLVKTNPELASGLKVGMELKIPQPKSLEKGLDVATLQPATEDSFLLHLVEPQQTLYSLALEYDVNIDSIRLINGGLKDGLKVGTTVRIPITKEEESKISELEVDTISSVVVLDSGELKNKYLISLLLPFYLDSNDSLLQKKLDYEKASIFRHSKIALDFYSGVKYALDEYENDSTEIEVKVHDISLDPSTKDTFQVNQLLAMPELFETNLFIGPFHRSNFVKVAEYAKSVNAPIVTPVPVRNSILKNNPFVIKTHSSAFAEVEQLRHFALQEWKDKNLILILNNELKDLSLGEYFLGISNSDTNEIMLNKVLEEVRVIKMSEFDTSSLNRVLNDSLENMLLMPLKSKTFIGQFLSGCNKYTRDFNIKIVGLDSWNRMGYLEYRYLNNLKVHTLRNQFINYTDSLTEEFILGYRNTVNTEPNEWAFSGYDLTNYLLYMLSKYGTAFQNYFQHEPYIGLSKNFLFERKGSENGFENKALKMVKVENYQYVEIPSP